MPQDRPPAYDGTISLNNAYSADSSTEGAPAMSKIADHLRRELGLTGSVREVIDAAAEQLGVPKNLALKEKAERCYAEVSFDGFSADDVEVIDTRTATRASERRQQQQNEAPVSEAESQARATLALLRLAALAQALEELEGETVSAQDITGCWLSLCCIPLCCSCSQKMGVERDGILTRGCCCFAFLPLCGIDTKRGRESGSNVFSLLGNPSDQEDFSSDSCACSGVWCSCKCCGAQKEKLNVNEITGCWVMCCYPGICWSCHKKTRLTANKYRTNGCCCLGPLPLCPVSETYTRLDDTNYFADSNTAIEMYLGPGRSCSGATCQSKIC